MTIPPLERKCHFERLTGADASLPTLQHLWQLGRVVDALPTPSLHLLQRRPGVVVPATVVPIYVAVRFGHPCQRRDRLSQRVKLTFSFTQRGFHLLACGDITQIRGEHWRAGDGDARYGQLDSKYATVAAQSRQF